MFKDTVLCMILICLTFNTKFELKGWFSFGCLAKYWGWNSSLSYHESILKYYSGPQESKVNYYQPN